MTTRGGKAENLVRLAGIARVPPFVVLSYEEALAGVTDAMRQQLQDAGLAWPLAVRSSAGVEDSEGASFAGQYETVLDVGSYAALEDALQSVARSGDADRVRTYAEVVGAGADAVRVNVIIQRMIAARAAGVCLTGLWGPDGAVLVEAVHGLGDTFVGGEEEGTAYLIESTEVRIRKQGQQYFAHYLGQGKVPLDHRLRRMPPLAKAEAMAIAEETVRVGREFGWDGTDVEFCFDAEGTWLLQARPLTARVGSG